MKASAKIKDNIWKYTYNKITQHIPCKNPGTPVSELNVNSLNIAYKRFSLQNLNLVASVVKNVVKNNTCRTSINEIFTGRTWHAGRCNKNKGSKFV